MRGRIESEDLLELRIVLPVDACVNLLDTIERRDEDLAQVLPELLPSEREWAYRRQLRQKPRRVRGNRCTLQIFYESQVVIYGIWVRPTRRWMSVLVG